MTNLSLNPSDRDDNRRTSRRFQSSTEIRFGIFDGDASMLLNGCIADVSRTGLRILFDREVAIGRRVSLQFGDNEQADTLEGNTIWCEQTAEDQFMVGCELHHKLGISEYIALCDFARIANDLEIAC